MVLHDRSANIGAFFVMCAIWGATWIAIAEGVRAVPPIQFAGSRFVAAGIVLMGWIVLKTGLPRLTRAEWIRLLVAAQLNVALCYAGLFWGMLSVDSGIAAVVNLSLTPVALYGFGLAYRQERFAWPALLALLIGALGLALLLMRGGRGASSYGMAAIMLGTASYCWGSVICRPLLRRHGALPIAGLLTLIGGAVLLALGLLVEPRPSLSAMLTPGVVVAWTFLVLAGSLVAYTIYLKLLRDWGPLRAGLFAYVSPIVAVALGVLVYGESVSAQGLAGIALMLGAAAAVPRNT